MGALSATTKWTDALPLGIFTFCLRGKYTNFPVTRVVD
jgi:hypothetical protein